jgi:hypothetical protein
LNKAYVKGDKTQRRFFMDIRNNTFIVYKIGTNTFFYRFMTWFTKILLLLTFLGLSLHIFFGGINFFMGLFVVSMILFIVSSLIGSFIYPNVIDIGHLSFLDNKLEISIVEKDTLYFRIEDISDLVINVDGYKGQMLYIMSFSTGRGLGNHVKIRLKGNDQSIKYNLRLLNRNQFMDLLEIKKFYRRCFDLSPGILGPRL